LFYFADFLLWHKGNIIFCNILHKLSLLTILSNVSIVVYEGYVTKSNKLFIFTTGCFYDLITSVWFFARQLTTSVNDYV